MSSRHRGTVVLTAVLVLVLAAGPATPAQAASGQKVTCAVTPSNVDRGEGAHVRGAVSPNARGQVVTLQLFKSGRWQKQQSTRLSSTSTYDFVLRPVLADIYTYRVGASRGSCAPVKLSVYGKLWLANVAPVGVDYTNYYTNCSKSDAEVNGSRYEHTCAIEAEYDQVDTNWIEWNLKRRCTNLTAVIGLDDNFNSDSAQVRLIISDEYDNQLYTHDYGIGDAVSLNLNVKGRLRIKFTTLGLNSSDPNYVELLDVGNPQVRCNWH